ncbi:MAG: tRNA (N6-threonylcarbamoyladenosine(37)-N6)-methyltransferase TrmO [Clostridia bacterium]|nr:tRNA (N6-threonylcarbamoyladenosine(37)-N6)-methyltransferase TrmO [Clostridia bacterium]
MKIIARIYNDFTDKFGIPRQSGIADKLVSKIVFEKEYRDPSCIKGIEDFSHLWLIWNFSKSERESFSPTVRPPRLGGNKRVGVFATRSPFRPNPIGLSLVKLQKAEICQEGPVLYVLGADLLNGTPIYDIKPYIPYSDCRTEAIGGFAEEKKDYRLKVIFPNELLSAIPKDKQESLITILEGDPRPSYQNDNERIYGMSFGGYEIKFKVDGTTLTVTETGKA